MPENLAATIVSNRLGTYHLSLNAALRAFEPAAIVPVKCVLATVGIGTLAGLVAAFLPFVRVQLFLNGGTIYGQVDTPQHLWS